MVSSAIAKQKAPRRSQAERSDQTITALRSVALELLLEGGVASLNLVALGQQAGYSRGIVHYHFGSKEALIVDLLQSLIEANLQSFANVGSEGLPGLLEILSKVEEAVVTMPKQSLARTLLLNEAAVSSSTKLTELLAMYNERMRGAIEAQISGDPAFASLGISAADCAALILATWRGIHHQWLAGRDAFDALNKFRAFRKLLEAFIDPTPVVCG